MKYIATVNGHEYPVEVIDEHHIRLNGAAQEIDFVAIGDQPVYSLIIEGKSYEAYISPEGETWQVLLIGRQYEVKIEEEREKRLGRPVHTSPAESGEFHLKAPMPGLIVSVAVQEGQEVQKGQVLLVLESMKMQNELRAPRPGKVERIRVCAGESVEQKQTLLSIV
jgi:biotin carboxyl carrier protein